MKTYRWLSVAAVAVMALLSSCSADEPEFPGINSDNPLLPEAGFDVSEVNDLLMSGSTTLERTLDIKTYKRDNEDSPWQEFDYTEWYGLSVSGPALLTIDNGNIYTPLTTFGCAHGPTRLSSAIWVLGRAGELDSDLKFMIRRDYALNYNTIVVNGEALSITNINKKWVRMVAMHESVKSDMQRTYWLDVITYNRKKKDCAYYFESVDEAYAYVMELFEKRFGEKVNLNTYSGGQFILDSPILYLESVKEELEAWHEGKLHLRL